MQLPFDPSLIPPELTRMEPVCACGEFRMDHYRYMTVIGEQYGRGVMGGCGGYRFSHYADYTVAPPEVIPPWMPSC